MKKTLLAILFCILIFSALAPNWASALSTNPKEYQSPQKGYYLRSIEQDGKPVGVTFDRSYFGNSDIPVSIQIFTDPNGFDLDFWIGSESLTDQQKATRNQIVELFDWIDDCINSIDNCANAWYDGQNGTATSDVYRFNVATAGAQLEISFDIYQMLQIAQEMYLLTNGAFNPASYRLVDLWGFSSRTYYKTSANPLPYDREWVAYKAQTESGDKYDDYYYPLPEQKYVDAFSKAEFVDFSQDAVTLTEKVVDGQSKYYVTKNVQPVVVDGVSYEQWLDLGGVAKGYVVDLIKQRIVGLGQTRYRVDAGGSSQSYGKDLGGNSVQLNIADPFYEFSKIFQVPLLSVDVADCAFSTSGQYVRNYVTNGVEYSHIVDAQKGSPAQTGVKSLTVLFPDDDGADFLATKADCISTAMTVLGRVGIEQFCNSEFAKQNNVDLLVIYQNIDGAKQILSNMSQDEVTFKDTQIQNYSWNLQQTNGVWVYDGNAQLIRLPQTNYLWVLILAIVVVVALFVLVVVFRFVRGKQKGAQNIQNAKRDKFFKPADVMVYLSVVLVIVVLFSVFFGADSDAYDDIQTISVVDLQTNQQLFVYNPLRNEYQISQDTSWDIQVTTENDKLVVRMQKDFDGEVRFNEFEITFGNTPTVKMTNSKCGYHQDCVRNFPQLNAVGQSIVCSPNYIKIVTA